MIFSNRQITKQSIKINRKIKDVIQLYRDLKIPMRKMITDFYHVKMYRNKLIEAENPWAYLYKGILGRDIESGASKMESAFDFGAMELHACKPTDVVNAAFYANKKRNDAEFELGYILPLFVQLIEKENNVLVVNPSPDMICECENNQCGNSRYYAVPNETIAEIYKIQFPNSGFVSFDKMNEVREIDWILLMNRDQKITACSTLLNCLECCNDKAKALFCVPNSWFDTALSGAYSKMQQYGFFANQMLVVDPGATVSTPRKKILLLLDQGVERPCFDLSMSQYNPSNRQFQVEETSWTIDADTYFKDKKTIVSYWNEKSKQNDSIETVSKYKKAEEYSFTREISLSYKMYPDKSKKYRGIVSYKEIKDVDLKTRGRKIVNDTEKGLKGNTREEIIQALEKVALRDDFYSVIKWDIEKNYVQQSRPMTFKTVWFYCRSELAGTKRYDDEFFRSIFKSESEISDIYLGETRGVTLLEMTAAVLDVEVADISYKAIGQLNLLLETALKKKLIFFNPVAAYLPEYTHRAAERQQDVRNALVKKHFTADEEEKIFKIITERNNIKGKTSLKCVARSIWLSPAIRLFTGMSIREVAALTWDDYRPIEGFDEYQIIITKFVDTKGKIITHKERENWKRFRVIPVANVLSKLLNMRKEYLLSLGIDERYLQNYPVVLSEERISEMRKNGVISHCKPGRISKICNDLIASIGIPENKVVLPDDKNDLVTDFSKYHGDIFLSNFRDKANHTAYLTMGELNYMIGLEAPDTFSRHYCDYTNDFVQDGIIQKLYRWTVTYENILSGKRIKIPEYIKKNGGFEIEVGPFRNGVAATELIVENLSPSTVELHIQSTHGYELNTTEYGVTK